jgi:hypothetical protein
MAASLNKIHAAAMAMKTSGLTQEALVILIHHKTRVCQRDVKAVLDGVATLADRFLTPEYRKLVKDGDK